MILRQTNRIIKDESMLFWYDPGRRESHTAGSSTTYDLSGRDQTGTWNITPTVENGYFVVDQNAQRMAAPLETNAYNYITISIWFKINYLSLPFFTNRASLPFQMSPANGTHLTFDFNDGDGGASYRTIWVYWSSSGTPLSAVASTTGHSMWLDDTWRQYTFKRDADASPYTFHYMNGLPVTDLTINRLGDQLNVLLNNGSGNVMYYGNLYNMYGNLGPTFAYNRALSDAEILYNYNVDKNRFSSI